MNLIGYIERLRESKPDFRATNLQVKRVCEFIVGHEINQRTWKRWRVKVDVYQWKRDLNWGETVALCTIAFLKKDNFDRKIPDSKILHQLMQDSAVTFAEAALSGKVQIGFSGLEAVQGIIEKHLGWTPSRSTIYRKIPNFEESKIWYDGEIEWLLSLFQGSYKSETNMTPL